MAGSGSMKQRGKKSWFFTVSCGLDKDGKYIRKTKTFRGTKREAQAALAEFVAEVNKGSYREPTKQTFRNFVERWLRDYAERKLARKTVHRYKTILNSRVLPALGDKKLGEITPADLLEFNGKLRDEMKIVDGEERPRLASRTILHHHRLISSILDAAVKWQELPDNPAKRIDAPTVTDADLPMYDEGQTQALLEAVADEPLKYRVIIMLALGTALRQGEIFGLEWQDIDFDNALLHVRRASSYVPGEGVHTKEPKTKTSKRTIAITGTILSILQQHKAAQDQAREELGDKWHGSNRVFTTWEGNPMYPLTMSSWFPQFLRRKGLTHMNFHGLRHLSATYMISKGAPIKNVSARLGHSRASTTLDIYSHALKSVDREIAEQMEGLFCAAKPNGNTSEATDNGAIVEPEEGQDNIQ